MTTKRWNIGRLNIFVGTSSRVGIEIMFDYLELDFAIQVLNVWIVFEWWPKESSR